MNDFIINESRRFAQIIHADVGKYENLSELKERFQREIIPYSSYDSKDIYLTNLTVELNKLFHNPIWINAKDLTARNTKRIKILCSYFQKIQMKGCYLLT
jgi:hypothetical protein